MAGEAPKLPLLRLTPASQPQSADAPFHKQPKAGPAFSTKKRALVAGGVVLVLVAIAAAVGTTVGLQQREKSSKQSQQVARQRAAARGTAGQGLGQQQGSSQPLRCVRRLQPSGAAPKRSAPAGPNQWTCRVYSTENVLSKMNLLLSLAGPTNTQLGSTVDLSMFTSRPWTREEGTTTDAKGATIPRVNKLGVIFEGQVEFPATETPEFLSLQLRPKALVDREFVNRIEIFKDQEATSDWEICIAPNTWVHESHGTRVFPTRGQAYLPSETPEHLQQWRAAELAIIKGTPEQQKEMRLEADRVYGYDIYNDLAGVDEATGKLYDRPVLGASKELPFPRRLRTGRPLIPAPNGTTPYESRPAPNPTLWLPLDERFNDAKNQSLLKTSLDVVVPTLVGDVRRKMFTSPPDTPLRTFADVDVMYASLQGDGDKEATLAEKVKGVSKFKEALVQRGRNGIWRTDTEYGRQALAGANPTVVRAVTSAADLGTITAAHLKGLIETYPLEVLLGLGKTTPKLLVIDHTAFFKEYAELITKQGPGRYGYWGRCLLFQDKEGLWRPVAIELQGWDDKAPTVYTPKDQKYVWLLAKGVFLTLDSGQHQAIAHLLRSHLVTEPYIIAFHRTLSALHPVYKLMKPHWHFTLAINARARTQLANAGGTLEEAFTMGRYTMEVGSKVYAAKWRFNKQGLPADLIDRGLATLGADGKLKLLLQDYPYADDGMLIWDAIREWVGQYLRLYYDDSNPKKSVAGDVELVSWWDEIQTKGHPDLKAGWPELKTVDDLTEILTTMIWVVSGHHAAVNFAQYGYSGYFLNRPTICTRPIPKKGTAEYKVLVSGELGGQKVYLDTLHNDATGRMIVTTQFLSYHASNEIYLGDRDHPYIMDASALDVHDVFVEKLGAAEKEMERRNKSKQHKLRQALAYELLMPTSGPGMTHRGVPDSVSI